MDYSALYRTIIAAYSAVPKRLFRGYAFPPIQVFVELTLRCNLRCAMCQNLLYTEQMSVDKRREKELTLQELKRIVDETPRFALVTLTGGEPLIRADFPDLLRYACARRRCHVTTNGVLLDAELAELMVASAARHVLGKGLVFVGISIHGPAEVHDNVTQLQGSFSRAAEGARNLAEMKAKAGSRLPHVYLCAVLTEETVETLPELPAIARELSADVLNIVLYCTSFDLSITGGAAIETMLERPRKPEPIEERLLTARLSETLRRCAELGVQVRLPRMPISEIAGYYAGKWNPSNYTCDFLWAKTSISSYGRVCICRHIEVGNVRQEPLKVIWNNARYRGFRQALKEQKVFPLCAGCCEIEYSPTKSHLKVSR